MTRIGHFLFHYRNALFPCAFALVFLPGPRLFADPMLAIGLGALFAALGQAVRACTIGLEYIVRGGRQRRVYAQELVTEGIYAHCRNPMYVGNLLLLTGIAVASNSWACLVIAIPLFAFIYACIVAAEEEFLRQKFGSLFDAYLREVPRWGLKVQGLGRTLHASVFHWRRLVVKEYGTVCAWIGGLCLLGLIRVLQANGEPESLRYLFLAILIASALAWLCAWGLKKSHVIVAD